MNPYYMTARKGLGGSSVPAPESPFGRMVSNAQQLATLSAEPGMVSNSRPVAPHAPYGHGNLPPMVLNPNDYRGAQGQARMLPNDYNIAALHDAVRDKTSGGVRPGVVPEMNAVEAARRQAPPQGPPPGGAVMRGYR